MDGVLVSVIERKAIQIARKDFQPSTCRGRAVWAVHINIEIARAVQQAVAAVIVVVEIIPDAQRIGGDAGVDLTIAQDRDIEPVVDVRPNIEIRGVISAQIDVIGQHFLSPHGADQQTRGIRGSIFRVLLPLVGNRRNQILQIRQQITVACGLLSRKFSCRAVRIIIRIIRRCGRHIEHRDRARYGKKLHGAKLDIRRLDGNVIRNFCHATSDLDSRQCQDAAGRRAYRNVAFIGHRQDLGFVGMRNNEIFPCRVFTQITALIGDNAHPVSARQALETQRRRGLVTVQDALTIVVVKIEIQVADGVFIRRAGYGHQRIGTNRHFDPNFRRAAANRLILVDAAAQNAQRKQ